MIKCALFSTHRKKGKKMPLTISISDAEALVSVFIESYLPIDTASRLHQSLRAIPGSGSSGQQENGVGCHYDGRIDQAMLSSTIYALLEQEGLMDSVGLSMTPFWRTRVKFNPAFPVEQMRQRREQLARLQDVWHASTYDTGEGFIFELLTPPTAEFYGQVVSITMT